MIPETYLPGFTYGPLGGFGTKPVKTKIRLNDQDKSCRQGCFPVESSFTL